MSFTYDKPLWKRILQLLLVCIAYYAVSLLVGYAGSLIGDLFEQDQTGQYLLFLLLTAVLSILVVLVFLRFMPTQRPILKTLTSADPGNKRGTVLFGVILAAVGYLVYLLVPLAAGGISLTFAPSDTSSLLLAVVVVLTAAFAEELDNRVFLFHNLRRTFRPPAIAVILSAVVFTAAHGVGDILSLIYYLSGAVIFLLMVCLLESTWCAYAYHITWNLLCLVFGEWDEGVGLFTMTHFSADAASFFRPDFGMGGDLPGIAVNLMLIAAVLVYARKKAKH